MLEAARKNDLPSAAAAAALTPLKKPTTGTPPKTTTTPSSSSSPFAKKAAGVGAKAQQPRITQFTEALPNAAAVPVPLGPVLRKHTMDDDDEEGEAAAAMGMYRTSHQSSRSKGG